MHREFHVYTDGACQVHRGKSGSWAYVIVDPQTEEILFEGSGLVKKTTSPTMELMAAVEALGRAWDDLPAGGVVLISDSTYVITGLKKWVHTWKKNKWINSQGKPVKQQELWKNFVYLYEKIAPELKWVKGHAGDRWNEYVDKLATQTLRFE